MQRCHFFPWIMLSSSMCHVSFPGTVLVSTCVIMQLHSDSLISSSLPHCVHLSSSWTELQLMCWWRLLFFHLVLVTPRAWTAAEALLPSLSLAPSPVRTSWLSQIQFQPKVNYGHSLCAGISLAVIAHGVPLPCASFFVAVLIYAAFVREEAAELKGRMHLLLFFKRRTHIWFGDARCVSIIFFVKSKRYFQNCNSCVLHVFPFNDVKNICVAGDFVQHFATFTKKKFAFWGFTFVCCLYLRWKRTDHVTSYIAKCECVFALLHCTSVPISFK